MAMLCTRLRTHSYTQSHTSYQNPPTLTREGEGRSLRVCVCVCVCVCCEANCVFADISRYFKTWTFPATSISGASVCIAVYISPKLETKVYYSSIILILLCCHSHLYTLSQYAYICKNTHFSPTDHCIIPMYVFCISTLVPFRSQLLYILLSPHWYSYSYDMTLTLQCQMRNHPGPAPPSCRKFTWNENLLREFEGFVHTKWILHTVHGFVGQHSIL